MDNNINNINNTNTKKIDTTIHGFLIVVSNVGLLVRKNDKDYWHYASKVSKNYIYKDGISHRKFLFEESDDNFPTNSVKWLALF